MHNIKKVKQQLRKTQGKDRWHSSALTLQFSRDAFMKDLKFKATVLTIFILTFCLNILGYLLL